MSAILFPQAPPSLLERWQAHRAARKSKKKLPKLTALEKAENFGWAGVFGHLIKWAVSALYFLIIQFHYHVFGRITNQKLYYDNLPYYVWHVWFRQPMQWGIEHYYWWLGTRHSIRDVGIGLVGGLALQVLVANSIKLKQEASARQLLLLPITAPLAGIPGFLIGWGIVSAIDAWVYRGPGISVGGTQVYATEINQFAQSASWHNILIGILASFILARFVAKRPLQTIQSFFIERDVSVIRKTGNWSWVRKIRPPAYRLRVRYMLDEDLPCEVHSATVSRILLAGVPIALFLVGFGFWLLYYGPAKGAH